MRLPAGALAVVVLVCGAASGQTIEPDARFQKAIADVGRARDQKQLEERLSTLSALDGKDFRVLVPQLVYYLSRQSDSHEAMVPAVIADRLHISDVQMASALVPYLDTRDQKLREQLDNLLGGIDDKDAAARRDFTAYAELLIRSRAAPPLALVRYMYRVDPDTAFDTMAQMDEPPVADRVRLSTARDRLASLRTHRTAGAIVEPPEIEAARAAVVELARDERWWARLYAARALAELAELRDRKLVESLRNDRHELVRDAANALAVPTS